MARKPKPGTCVYCLVETDDLTWDHVLPRSWYPDCTPADLEKWKVPACGLCNRRYGEIEKRLLIRLGLCVDPHGTLAAGVGERALRSLKPEYATDENDRGARQKLRDTMLAETQVSTSLPEKGILPGFGPPGRLERGRYRLIRISEADLQAFGEKLVRGITYLDQGRCVGPDYLVEIHIVKEGPLPEIDPLLRTLGEVTHRGPGFVVVRAKGTDDPIAAIFRMIIWGHLRLHAVVLPLGGRC